MKINHKNITISITKTKREGRIGTSRMIINVDIALAFYEKYKYSHQIFDLQFWLVNRTENFSTKNPDLQVLLYKFMLENPLEKYNISVETEDEFWIYHDIAHSQKDVFLFNVVIHAENEEERLKETVNLMQRDISEDLKKDIEQEYFNSFRIKKKLF